MVADLSHYAICHPSVRPLARERREASRRQARRRHWPPSHTNFPQTLDRVRKTYRASCAQAGLEQGAAGGDAQQLEGGLPSRERPRRRARHLPCRRRSGGLRDVLISACVCGFVVISGERGLLIDSALQQCLCAYGMHSRVWAVPERGRTSRQKAGQTSSEPQQSILDACALPMALAARAETQIEIGMLCQEISKRPRTSLRSLLSEQHVPPSDKGRIAKRTPI